MSNVPLIQAPSLILPQFYVLGNEIENIDDLLEHTSIEFPIEQIDQKMVNVVAVEVTTAGVPGPLWTWIELSPVDSVTSAAYWAAIGGGGGALAPLVPIITNGTGVDGTVHTFTIPWRTHSTYARAVVQSPVSAAIATAFWRVQVLVSGKN